MTESNAHSLRILTSLYSNYLKIVTSGEKVEPINSYNCKKTKKFVFYQLLSSKKSANSS